MSTKLYDYAKYEQFDARNLREYLTNALDVILIGEIKLYAGRATPVDFLECNGAEVSKERYSELYNVIGDLYGTPTDDTKFVLPNLINKFPEGAIQQEVGQTVAAGLPNITGRFYAYSYSSASGTGAFSGAEVSSSNQLNAGSSSNRNFDIIPFNASKGETNTAGNIKTSSEIKVYGKSNTVQPPAVKIHYIIRAK